MAFLSISPSLSLSLFLSSLYISIGYILSDEGRHIHTIIPKVNTERLYMWPSIIPREHTTIITGPPQPSKYIFDACIGTGPSKI